MATKDYENRWLAQHNIRAEEASELGDDDKEWMQVHHRHHGIP